MNEHKCPTPEDTYCNNCGLSEEFWGKVPECPAKNDSAEDPASKK